MRIVIGTNHIDCKQTYLVFTVLLLVGQNSLPVSATASDRYVFTRLEGPDKEIFLPRAINGKGQIVGELLSRAFDGPPNRAALRDADGRFTTVAYPDARFTTLWGINSRGKIVGSTVDTKGLFGFVREPDGRFVRFKLDVPDIAPDSTPIFNRPIPIAINDQGVILGTYSDKSLRTQVFLLREDGGIRTFTAYGSTYYWGLNTHGQVVGDSLDFTGTRHGILRDGKDKVTLIDWPKTTLTEAKAINYKGVIVGVYLDPAPGSGPHRSFVRDTTGNLTAFDFPGIGKLRRPGSTTRARSSAGVRIMRDFMDSWPRRKASPEASTSGRLRGVYLLEAKGCAGSDTEGCGGPVSCFHLQQQNRGTAELSSRA